MYLPLTIVALIALILAGLLFLVAGADVTVSDLTATREIAWGLFCATVGVLCWLCSGVVIHLKPTA